MRLAALILMAMASTASAETVRVRSGEHAGFSRLVVDLATPSPWQFWKREGGYLLHIDRPDIQFDTSGVFRLIPRTRISDAADGAEMSRLLISVDCACHSQAFEISPGRIVIDIKDGRAGETAQPYPGAMAQLDNPFSGPRVGFPAQPKLRAKPAPKPAANAIPVRQPVSVIGGLPVLENAAPPKPAAPKAAIAAPDPQVQKQLAEQLARATAQGLVTAQIGTKPAENAPRVQAEDAEEEGGDTLGTAEPLPPGIRIRTSADRDTYLPTAPGQTSAGLACFRDALVSPGAWGAPISPAALIAARRSALIGEFDKADPATVADLAAAYLYLGFGAEVRALLSEFDATWDGRDVYLAIAGLMDGAPMQAALLFSNQWACENEAALWAVASVVDIPRGENINTGAVTRSFSAMPLHLRQHFGPDLIQKFAASGDKATAQAISNAILRVKAEPDENLKLVQAGIELSEGQTARAEASLKEIVATDGPTSPEAMALLLESRTDAGLPAEPADIALAEALVFEHADTPAGQRLIAALAASNALAGDYPRALQQAGQVSQAFQAETVSKIAEILSGQAPDIAFLQYLPKLARMHGGAGLGLAQRGAAARRALDLGFAQLAADLWGADAATTAPDQQILTAEIQLALGNHVVALAILEADNSMQAEALRGRVYKEMGQHSRAALHFRAAGQHVRAADSLWLTDTLAQSDGGPPDSREEFSLFVGANAQTGGWASPAGNPTDLQDFGKLADMSQNARAIYGALLADQESGPTE